MENKELLSSLFDLYSNLLTENQAYIFECYYFDNLSLSEIADNENVSRNAVFLQLKRVKRLLLNYEEKLHLLDKYKRIVKLAKEINNDKSEKIIKIIEE